MDSLHSFFHQIDNYEQLQFFEHGLVVSEDREREDVVFKHVVLKYDILLSILFQHQSHFTYF